MSTLDDAIDAIKNGDKDTGRQLLEQILEEDENNEEVWLWLSTVVERDDDREICLENVMALNPENELAQQALNAVRDGHFDPRMIIGEEREKELPTITFHDDFFGEGEAVSDELEMPSVMGGAPEPKIKQKKEEEAKKNKKSLNPRLIIMAVAGLLACVVLGGLGAVLFSGGGDTETPVEAPSVAETPANPAPDGSTPIPEEEPTPAPTNTPALSLPTAKPPEDEPTPIATQVVSPTPPPAPDEAPPDNAGE